MASKFERYNAIMEGQKKIGELLDDPNITDERVKEL